MPGTCKALGVFLSVFPMMSVLSAGSSQAVTTLHVIGFLKEILQYFPAQVTPHTMQCNYVLMALKAILKKQTQFPSWVKFCIHKKSV